MDKLINAIRHHAEMAPTRVALIDDAKSLTYAQLAETLREASGKLANLGGGISIFADNSVEWAVADLAALVAKKPTIPLAHFFSPAQVDHVVRAADVRCILTDQASRVRELFGDRVVDVADFFGDFSAVHLRASNNAVSLPKGTQKITFTSGTTADPKGVCLGSRELEWTAAALCSATGATSLDRHLCVLPLATLLENIGGIYSAMLAGATACVPRLARVGLSGSSGLDIETMLESLRRWRATSVILVPQMLDAMTRAIAAGEVVPETLRHVAVGGAPIATHVLNDARQLGLPVFEGYGLSECASVVALNRANAFRIGSVGKPLPHLRIEIADDGEIIVRGVKWRGYLGAANDGVPTDRIATGDIGFLDDSGYLHITGRKKNIFITSFGRNVAPEWVESELVSRHPILQAAVFGEAKPFNTAVIVRHPAASEQDVDNALVDANRRLPDYARVTAWTSAREPFTPQNGLSTFNGRLRRPAIFNIYRNDIESLYAN